MSEAKTSDPEEGGASRLVLTFCEPSGIIAPEVTHNICLQDLNSKGFHEDKDKEEVLSCEVPQLVDAKGKGQDMDHMEVAKRETLHIVKSTEIQESKGFGEVTECEGHRHVDDSSEVTKSEGLHGVSDKEIQQDNDVCEVSVPVGLELVNQNGIQRDNDHSEAAECKDNQLVGQNRLQEQSHPDSRVDQVVEVKASTPTNLQMDDQA